MNCKRVGRLRAALMTPALAISFVLCAASAMELAAAEPGAFRIAVFRADVTPPLGHQLMTGGGKPAEGVDDPLEAGGFVLMPPGEKPLVFVSVDWTEIRNEAFDRWRNVLAEAAGTDAVRVLVSCVHQHDAPLADLHAQRLLEAQNSKAQIIDPAFHEQTVQRVAGALTESLKSARRVTHLGTGQAKVEQVASNRRFVNSDGTPNYGRYSASGGDALASAAEEGTIDPYLKTLSFYDGDKPVAMLNIYATHPMSYYSTGRVSSDFPGRARERRQADDPDVLQIYASGASGNVTAGKYNDGTPRYRPILAERLYRGMVAAQQAITRHPLGSVEFRSVKLRLEPRDSPGFTREDLQQQLENDSDPKQQALAALGLSWRERADAGHEIDVPVIDFGAAQLVLLPAEIYVEYQLYAQQLRPDAFVIVAGYGECAPGYIPIERAWNEHDQNLHTWCWVAPGAEPRIHRALRVLLQAPDSGK